MAPSITLQEEPGLGEEASETRGRGRCVPERAGVPLLDWPGSPSNSPQHRRAWVRSCTDDSEAPSTPMTSVPRTSVPTTPTAPEWGEERSAVFDVVAGPEGEPALLSATPRAEGDSPSSTSLRDLPDDEVITARVFRFFDDVDDHVNDHELQLRNVNTGSIMWLLVHLLPKMHSVKGSKYGKWFTVHVIRAQAKHFRSGYHACDSGRSFATRFGATAALTTLVTGEKLDSGYFWFVHPVVKAEDSEVQDVTHEDHLLRGGWQHLGRSSPIHGEVFLEEWRRGGCPNNEEGLQAVLERIFRKPL